MGQLLTPENYELVKHAVTKLGFRAMLNSELLPDDYPSRTARVATDIAAKDTAIAKLLATTLPWFELYGSIGLDPETSACLSAALELAAIVKEQRP